MKKSSLAATMAQQLDKPISHQYAHTLFQRLLAGLQLSLPFRAAMLTYISQDGSQQNVHFGEVDPITESHDNWLKRTDWHNGIQARQLDEQPTLFEILSEEDGVLTFAFCRPSVFRWGLFTLDLTSKLTSSHIELICLSAPMAWQEIDRLVLESPCHEAPLADLTKREAQVLEWLSKGKSTWEISHILDIKERTVKYHVGRILEKYGVDNRVQLLVKLLGGTRIQVA